MPLPNLVTEPDIDDTQSQDVNLNSLVRKYIDPIDQLRSFSAPNLFNRTVVIDDNERARVAQNQLNTAGFVNAPRESRAHCFYRMLGLPVVGGPTQFYSPGYNPFLSRDTRINNEAIAAGVPQAVRRMQQNRENGTRNRLAIFDRQGSQASIFAVAMAVPDGQRRFQVIDETLGPLDEDLQEEKLPGRKAFIERNYQNVDGSDITTFFDNVNHRLRPFQVSPEIDNTVKPQRRLVCAPFLRDRNATKLEQNVFLLRPGIEFILRLRLRDFNDQGEVRAALPETILNDSAFSVSNLTESDIFILAAALLDRENVSLSDIEELLLTRTTVELVNINNYVKLIKALVDEYIAAISTIRNVQKTISWKPLPNPGGPEQGTQIGNFIALRNINSVVEQRIVSLTGKGAAAQRQFALSTDGSLTNNNFTISEFENTRKFFDDELERAKAVRRSAERRGSEALKAIELIGGEISGFGLLDILTVYTALWAVDLDTLISLLDDTAFNNLVTFNPDLIVEPVETRQLAGPVFTIEQALQSFESQIVNILTFIDRLFENAQGNPKNAEGGDISRNSG